MTPYPMRCTALPPRIKMRNKAVNLLKTRDRVKMGGVDSARRSHHGENRAGVVSLVRAGPRWGRVPRSRAEKCRNKAVKLLKTKDGSMKPTSCS